MTKYAKVRLLESLATELNRRARAVGGGFTDAPWRAWLKRAKELFESGDGIRRLYPVKALGLPKGGPELAELLRRMVWAMSDTNIAVVLNIAAKDVLNGKA